MARVLHAELGPSAARAQAGLSAQADCSSAVQMGGTAEHRYSDGYTSIPAYSLASACYCPVQDDYHSPSHSSAESTGYSQAESGCSHWTHYPAAGLRDG